MGILKSQQLKLRAIAITLSIGFIVLSGLVLIKEPAHGRDNLGSFCTLVRNAAPVLMLASCLLISLTAVRLRMSSIIGTILIIGSLLISYFISERTGYSMGTWGWSSTFVSMFVIIPLGLFLCVFNGLASLIHILKTDSGLRTQVVISAAAMFMLGFAYYLAADSKPDIYSLIEAIKGDDLNHERFSIALKLSEIDDDEMVPLLIDMLEDNNPRIREAAVVALGGRQRKARAKALPPLLKALKSETDEKAKTWMILGLASVVPLSEKAERDMAVDTLIEILQGEDRSLKGAAAESLGWIKDERAIPPLIDALSDEPFHAHNALITITGKRFEGNPEVWRKWFEETKRSIPKPE